MRQRSAVYLLAGGVSPLPFSLSASRLACAACPSGTFPQLNAISRKSAFTKLDLREQLVGNYVAVYRVDHAAQAVYLLHLFHQSQDFEHLL